jgi:hypothetical protein
MLVALFSAAFAANQRGFDRIIRKSSILAHRRRLLRRAFGLR